MSGIFAIWHAKDVGLGHLLGRNTPEDRTIAYSIYSRLVSLGLNPQAESAKDAKAPSVPASFRALGPFSLMASASGKLFAPGYLDC